MKQLTASDRWIIVVASFLLWLVVAVPFWLLGTGLAGELVLWPSFEPDVWLLSLLWVVVFYGPLLLITIVAIDAIRSRQHTSEPQAAAKPKP
jgi:hypothetical protein